MNKFINLLKKEVKELVTFQLVISLLFTMVLFYFIGNIVQSEVKKIEEKQEIYVLNLDDSQESETLLNGLSYAGFKVNLLDKEDKDQAVEHAKNSEINLLLVIPEGFGQAASEFKFKEIEAYYFIRSFSMASSASAAVVDHVISEINKLISNNFLKANFPDLNPEDIKNPIKSKGFVVVNDVVAEGVAAEISNIVYSQSIFIPVILMMIIVFSSQMVLSAMAMEKQDKTLETLLTVPINRKQIAITKMVASALVGLLSAVIYMVGFRYYMSGFMGDVTASSQLNDLMQRLGLQYTSADYVILGISIFFAILCALGLTIILGVMVEDLKSAETMVLPLTFLVMIPYFISMFSDINSLSLPVKALIMLIPFSHPFIASQNILLGNYDVVFYGIAYMLVVFIILIFICGRIFSTDRVLTMKLRFGKKGLLNR